LNTLYEGSMNTAIGDNTQMSMSSTGSTIIGANAESTGSGQFVVNLDGQAPPSRFMTQFEVQQLLPEGLPWRIPVWINGTLYHIPLGNQIRTTPQNVLIIDELGNTVSTSDFVNVPETAPPDVSVSLVIEENIIYLEGVVPKSLTDNRRDNDTFLTSYSQPYEIVLQNYMISDQPFSHSVKRYYNIDFIGIDFSSKPIDVSSGTLNFYMSFWTATISQITLKIVRIPGVDEGSLTIQPLNSQWNVLDVPITSFSGLSQYDTIKQIVVDSGIPPSGGEIFISAILFHQP